MNIVSNSHQYLLGILNSIQPLSAELQERLCESFKQIVVKKNSQLIREGEPCLYAWLLIRGMARSYIITSDQKESTGRIMGPGYFITSVIAFYENEAAVETIEILENSLLLQIAYQDLEDIYKDFPEFNYHSRKLTEKYVVLMSKRELMLRNNDARERYSIFHKYFEKLINTVPLKLLASFSRMERATFTKIKNNKYS